MTTLDLVQRYNAHKERARERQASQSRSGRDIGPPPAVVDAARKDAAKASFRAFLETYFPGDFYLGWSDDHLKAIARIESAVIHGGLFAFAMPRGSGKTTLSERAVLWAILYGFREFVALIGSDEGHAAEMLDHLKTELESNELLAEDFPEVCHPIQALDGISQRASGQHIGGERTHVVWTSKRIVLPTVEGSPASGAVVKVAGITGRVRGMNFKRADGRTVRPSLVILDDPQTDESARSESQCTTREGILAGAVLGLAGPGRKIAGMMPCTVIRPGDMADRILDREKHPEWRGERTKLCYSFPDNKALWAKYAKIREGELRSGAESLVKATAFYKANRAAMDKGCVPAWPERFEEDEVSAVQNIMNLMLTDEEAFFAEYQNEPLLKSVGDVASLSAEAIAAKVNGYRRREVPENVSILTFFCDVHQDVLYWMVVGWCEDFTGYVLDYGTFPDQGKPWFTLRDAKQTLAKEFPKAGFEGSIRAGLDAIAKLLLEDTAWVRDDGAEMTIDRGLIDANWDQSTDVVYQFCRESVHSSQLTPSHGQFVGAGQQPMGDRPKKPGDRTGHNWRMPRVRGRVVRHVVFDSNYWKSFVHSRLAVAIGDPGSLTLFKSKKQPHKLLSEHLTAEYRVRKTANKRTVDEWKIRPERPDNHYFDCLVGCSVGASMTGATIAAVSEAGTNRRKPRAKVKLSKLQRC